MELTTEKIFYKNFLVVFLITLSCFFIFGATQTFAQNYFPDIDVPPDPGKDYFPDIDPDPGKDYFPDIDPDSLELELRGDGRSRLGGLERTAIWAGYSNIGDYNNSIPVIVALIIQAFLGLLGVIFVVLIIYGGYLWMTARGNEQRVEKAKNTLQAAIIGLVIVISAYAITSFIGTQLQNAGAPPAEEEAEAGG